MKLFQDFVVATLLVASAQAAGSGPYLPSGWRPDGPAFLLPGEVHESPAVPLKSAQESVAAGSDSLREYGPPKLEEVSQDITQQALPDEAAAPPFSIIRTDIHEDIVGSEATTAQETEGEGSLGTTQATVDTEIQSKIEAKSIKFDSIELTSKDGESQSNVEKTKETSYIQADDDTVSKTEEFTQIRTDNTELVKETANTKTKTADNNSESETEAYIEIKTEKIESLNEAQVKSAYDVDDAEPRNEELSQVNTEEVKQDEESDSKDEDNETTTAKYEALEVQDENKETGVNNISEALANLEKEITNQQDHKDAEVKKIADIAGTGQPFPEGFLEYGPPGFKEYGPPTLRKVVEPSAANEVGNDVRRRRFSPKFKITSSKKTSSKTH